MAASIEGADRSRVFEGAVAVQDPLCFQLRELVELGAVNTWSSDQVRVFSHRPWDEHGKCGALVHVARVEVAAEFVNFERLSGFLDYWSAIDGVEVSGVGWDVTRKNRRAYEAEVRKAALDDAVLKAQVYANAVRRGKVVAVQISDPGMLTGPSEGPGSPPMIAKMSTDMGAGPSLELSPEDIVIHVEVDARFHAE